jgi:TrmH family RNA methyltransferase
MLSKAQNKYIRSLTQHKFRLEHKAYIAEGDKIALEWLHSNTPIDMVVATAEWAQQHADVIARHKEATLHIVNNHELSAISSLTTANQVLLVVPTPEAKSVPVLKEWAIALDEIQDPGNMGTIIRIADWFGINHIFCSEGCVDIYNHKVVQSAMGGHLRVNVYKGDLEAMLKQQKIPRLAAMLNGTDIYKVTAPEAGIIMIGNESKGLSEAIAVMADQKVTIPRRGGAESLNAGVSLGILCALLVKG